MKALVAIELTVLIGLLVVGQTNGCGEATAAEEPETAMASPVEKLLAAILKQVGKPCCPQLLSTQAVQVAAGSGNVRTFNIPADASYCEITVSATTELYPNTNTYQTSLGLLVALSSGIVWRFSRESVGSSFLLFVSAGTSNVVVNFYSQK